MTLSRDIQVPRAIFFDWDATLADTYNLMEDAYSHCLQTFGYPSRNPGWLRPVFGKTKEETYPIFYTNHTEADYPVIDKVFVDHIQAHHLDAISPMNGAENVLKLLRHHKVPCGVVTNKRPYLIKPEVDHFGWGDYFDVLVAYGDAANNKPSADPLYLAASLLEIEGDVDNVWLIGDSASDQGCARNAGCTFVHYHDGCMPDLDYTDYAPLFSIKHYDELYKILSEILK